MQKPSLIKHLFILLFITQSFFATAQEKMIAKDGKEYNATSTWKFSCKDYAYTGILEVQIAKTEKGGLLKLGIEVSNETFYIGDTVYIILEDGSYITCTDKGIRELKGKKTIAYYFLTATEMNKLKGILVTDVRFRIKGNEDTFSSKTGHFTAINKKSDFQTFGTSEESKTFDTKTEIKSLYN
ncbi:hypothetical protein J2X31_001558 [Flavobacterium arsenatis]|uniref:Calcium-binding protein n=1 Tax=Flavobacterium arsenatis TaxID=1484332 RepID=A0ABU1TNK3_9FLAO|nr:hypothetical protein [Flavobacterium arsenatis]MDR6967547.1 hypothetical protein [Flavobacterium arsenatis]